MVEQNPYTVLGVRTQASEQEIHDAYRRLAKAHHPDLHPGDKLAEENFKEIAAAYELLSDAERRAEFDRSDAQAADAERPHAYSPDRGYDGAWFEAQAEAVADGGEFVATQRRMRPWALICLGLLLILAMGYGVARGISLSVDGVVVRSERTTAALDVFLVLGRTGSRSRIGFEHSVRGGDGQYQTIMAGPICSRLSSASLPVGTRLHKEAWNPRYELNGQPLGSNLTIGCSVKLGFWFLFALGLISVGLIDWANSRGGPRSVAGDVTHSAAGIFSTATPEGGRRRGSS